MTTVIPSGWSGARCECCDKKGGAFYARIAHDLRCGTFMPVNTYLSLLMRYRIRLIILLMTMLVARGK